MRAPAPSDPRWREALGAVGAGLLALGFCAALLWRNPLLCWKDDFAISILPVFTDIARAWRAGEWPLLSPGSWVCANLAGEYQYGTFSPAVNLAALFADALPVSLPLKAAALSLPHVGLMAAGCYLLARRREIGPAGATMVAVVGSLNGWNIAWGATDWFGALAANAWLPWCWWAFEGALRPGETRFGRRVLWPAGTVFLLLTGGFPYTVGMLGLVTAWLGLRTWAQTRKLLAPWPLAAGWTAGIALSAPAWLSLLEHMAGSDRAAGANVVANAWGVPWRALAGFVNPAWTVPWADFGGHYHPRPALELAGALVPLALLAAGLWVGRGTAVRRVGWDLALTAVALVLCVLPSVGVFRWSFRWLPLFHLALALTAARAVVWSVSRSQWDIWVAWVPWVSWSRVRPWLPAVAALASLWLTYTTLGTNPGVPHYPFTENLRQPGPLSPDRLYLSLYREPYFHYTVAVNAPAGFGATLRPGSTSLFAANPELRFINAYSPIVAAGVGRRLKMDTHGNIPEAAARQLAAEELGPGGLLARLGVDGLIVSEPYFFEVLPPDNEWELVHADAEGRVYHRRGSPTADVRALNPVGGANPSVRLLENGRQRIVAIVAASDAAMTVAFRRPFLPGWRVTLDGRPIPVTAAENGLFPTVDLPAGAAGRLTLSYRPRALVLGAALAAAGVAALAVAGWRWRRRA